MVFRRLCLILSKTAKLLILLQLHRYERYTKRYFFVCAYSLVKMVHGFAKKAERGDHISEIELEHSIRRNFSGLDDLDAVKIFSREFPKLKRKVKVKELNVYASQ